MALKTFLIIKAIQFTFVLKNLKMFYIFYETTMCPQCLVYLFICKMDNISWAYSSLESRPTNRQGRLTHPVYIGQYVNTIPFAYINICVCE